MQLNDWIIDYSNAAGRLLFDVLCQPPNLSATSHLFGRLPATLQLHWRWHRHPSIWMDMPRRESSRSRRDRVSGWQFWMLEGGPQTDVGALGPAHVNRCRNKQSSKHAKDSTQLEESFQLTRTRACKFLSTMETSSSHFNGVPSGSRYFCGSSSQKSKSCQCRQLTPEQLRKEESSLLTPPARFG